MEATFAEAAARFAEKKYFDAVRIYTSIASSEAASADDKARAFNNISACYALVKEYDKSLQTAEEALALQPMNAKAMGRAATACEGLRRYEDAATHFAAALRIDTGNTVYAEGLARVRALVQARRGLASDASRDQYYYAKSLERGKASMVAGNYLEAVRHYTKAVDLLPSSTAAREVATLYANRSAAHLRAGAPDQSADDALAATDADPTYARGFFRLASAQQRLKRYGDCYDSLKQCLALEPEHAEAAALLAEVEPTVQRERMSAAERAARDSATVAELKEQQAARQAEEAARVGVVGRHAHAARYVYCSYCNESGHTKADCPMRRKRPLM